MRGALKGADVFQAVPGQIFGLGDSQGGPRPLGPGRDCHRITLFAHYYILGGEVGQGI